jgi:hypothetical protein
VSRWYRAYEGTVTDPKLAEAALVAGCSRSVAVAAWHLHLENAATINDSGRIDLPPLRIAAALCEPLAVIEALVAAFAATGIVRDSHVVSWNRRQYLGDHSAERVRRHRAKKTAETLPCNDSETLRNVSETDHRQRQRTEGSDANASGGEPPKLSASDVTKAIFDSGISILMAAGHDNRSARSIIGRWRKSYTDSEVLTVLSRCPDDVSQPVEWVPAALKAERARNTGHTNGRNHTEHRNGIAAALDRRLGLGEPAGEAGRLAIGDVAPDNRRPLAIAAPMQ